MSVVEKRNRVFLKSVRIEDRRTDMRRYAGPYDV